MKKISLLTVILFMPLIMMAQGIIFNAQSQEQALAEAKKQNKLIFIDFHTTWCGPCKMIARDIFPLKEAGEYYNKEFICLKLDAEKEGKEWAEKLKVASYPTLMFINGDMEILLRRSGTVDLPAFLNLGADAKVAAEDPNSFYNMKKSYAQRSNDDAFLRMYIEKQKEGSENPRNTIEKYLEIQTEYKENYSEMMELFMNNAKYLLCGGKAEEIFLRNKAEYLDIATQFEERKVKGVHTQMMSNTYRTAMSTKDAEMLKLYIDRFKKTDDRPYYQDLNLLHLDLLQITSDDKNYVTEAISQLDSVVASRTVEDIVKKDKKRYDDYCKKNPGGGFFLDFYRESNNMLDAKLQVGRIDKYGRHFLDIAKKKQIKKYFPNWIEHAKKLNVKQLEVLDLESLYYEKIDDMDNAIKAKEARIAETNPKAREYSDLVKQLEQLKTR